MDRLFGGSRFAARVTLDIDRIGASKCRFGVRTVDSRGDVSGVDRGNSTFDGQDERAERGNCRSRCNAPSGAGACRFEGEGRELGRAPIPRARGVVEVDDAGDPEALVSGFHLFDSE
jgi:hypothetical protein